MSGSLGASPFSVQYFGLHTAQHNGLTPSMHASISAQQSSWSPSYRSQSDSLSSPTENGPVYSPLTPHGQSTDLTFTGANGASMSQSSVYASSGHSGAPSFQQLSPLHPSHDSSAMCFPQLESSVGPSRVTTRGQRRAVDPSGRRHFGSSPYPSRSVPSSPQRGDHSLFHSSMGPSSPRPDSPGILSPRVAFSHSREHLSLDMSGLHSSTGHHSYPASPASPSAYHDGARPEHSRMHSHSSSHPRSNSPALSTVTSVSSNSSPPNLSCRPSSDPPISPIQERPKGRKQRLYNVDRKAICVFHKENPTARQEDIATRYGVERSTISKILKQKNKWLNIDMDDEMKVAKHRTSKFPELEGEMLQWLMDTQGDPKLSLSDNSIRNKAKELARGMGIREDRFKASSGWVENFKNRHGIRHGRWEFAGRNTSKTRAFYIPPRVPVPSPPPSPRPLQPAYDPDGRLIGHLPSAIDMRQVLKDQSVPNDVIITQDHPMHQGLRPVPRSDWPDDSHTMPGCISARGIGMMNDHQSAHSHSPLIGDHHLGSPTSLAPPSSIMGTASQGHVALNTHSPSSAPVLSSSDGMPQATSSHSEVNSFPHSMSSSINDNSIPTSLDEAKGLIRKVVMFFETHGQGLLTPEQKSGLDQTKEAVLSVSQQNPTFIA